MAAVFFTVEDNTSPTIEIELRRAGSAMNLTDATLVELFITNRFTKTLTNNLHKTCFIIDRPTGVVSYNVQAGDFPSPNVPYTGEVKVTWNSGQTERIYNRLQINVRPNDE